MLIHYFFLDPFLHFFGGDAIQTAYYLINHIPSVVSRNISPYQRFFGISPNYDLLSVFRCACFVLLPKKDRFKLSARSSLCVFLGYGVEQKEYRCYHPETSHLFVSRHVVFLEKISYYQILKSSSLPTKQKLISIDSFTTDEPNDDISSCIDIYNHLHVDLRPPIIHTYSCRNVQQPEFDSQIPNGPFPSDFLNVPYSQPLTPRHSRHVRRPPKLV